MVKLNIHFKSFTSLIKPRLITSQNNEIPHSLLSLSWFSLVETEMVAFFKFINSLSIKKM